MPATQIFNCTFWVKENLKIKSCLKTLKNTVLTQSADKYGVPYGFSCEIWQCQFGYKHKPP